MKKNQFSEMSAAELNDKVVELKKELFNLRFQSATGQIKNPQRIGECKKESNIAIIQASRWDVVLEGVLKSADIYGLDREFVAKVFNAIHEASVQEQNKILSE